ncbi:glycosyl hydrolase [Bacteroides difficilis]|nr:glycosyl hydrolase [Bacteroides difficilis]
MKTINKIFTFMCILTLFGACTKDQMITDLTDEDGTVTSSNKATTYKRGCGFSLGTSTGQWWANIINLKANWYYTWGLTGCQDPYAPQNVEFVPMFWGHTNVTQSNIDMVNDLYRQKKIFYVLGFNEPDLKEEGNMSVEQALEDWKKLSDGLDPGIKLVSPAVSWPGAAWFNDFMKGVQSQNLRMDYIALHIYMGQSPQTYSDQVKKIFSTYGKKIWITEFAPRDDSATSGQPETNKVSEEWIRNNFIEPVLTDYENMDEVFRYAWFSGSPTMAGLWTSMLVDKDGKLTSLGDYYATIHPNDDAAPANGMTMPQ